MNTNIAIFVETGEDGRPDLFWQAGNWFEQTEKRFSRFLPDSELSRINRLAGERTLVSENMLEVLLLADSYRRNTDGLFEPFVLQALQMAGYTRSFETLTENLADWPTGAVNPPMHRSGTGRSGL